MSVTSAAKLTRAYKFMPFEEKTDARDVVLVDGDLYFGGDRAWFKIENFMKSNVDFRIRVNEMKTILSMKGEIEAMKVDDYSVMFTNGNQNMKMFCIVGDPATGNVSVPKSVSPLLDSDYDEPPRIVKRMKGIDALIDENCTAGVVTHTDANGDSHGYMIIFKDTVLAVVKGEPGIDMDLTTNPEIVSEITTGGTKIKLDKKIVHGLTEGDGFKIYSSVNHSMSRFTEKVKSFSHNLAEGSMEVEDSLEPLTTISIKATSFLDATAPIFKMKHEGYMTIETSGNRMKLSVSDTIKNLYETELDCDNNGAFKFETNLVTPAIVNFLMGAVNTTPDKAMLNFIINPWKKRMIIRMTPNDDSVNALCMMKVMI